MIQKTNEYDTKDDEIMNLSMKWLSDFVDVNCPIREYAEAMTMSGSKVEGYETEGSEISNVVVGNGCCRRKAS